MPIEVDVRRSMHLASSVFIDLGAKERKMKYNIKVKMFILAFAFTCIPFISMADSRSSTILEEMLSQEVSEYQLLAQSSCYGVAQCRGGYEVYCTAYGRGCRYNVIPGVGVKCTGMNEYGQWATWWARCR